MKAIKARFESGQIKLTEPAPDDGPVDVLVVFPEVEDPWDAIINDPTPRPALAKWIAEVKEEIKAGKAVPMDLDQL